MLGAGAPCTGVVACKVFAGGYRWVSAVFVEVRDNMLVLITYDVNTETAAGKKRLRQCVDYGQRVQNSVFECIVDPGQCKLLKNQLLKIVDLDKDSLRFYYLGNQYQSKIEHYGAKKTVEQEGVLIL